MFPSLVLKKMVMGNFPNKKVDKEIADSVDFMVERVRIAQLMYCRTQKLCCYNVCLFLQLESLSQQDLASRLTMNCVTNFVDTRKLSSIPITITDVFDEYALSSSVREDMYLCYPHAKLAHLKSGGNFPYLSRSDEINLHLQVKKHKLTIE